MISSTPNEVRVSEFPSSHDGAFEYPGKPPEYSYLTDGEYVLQAHFKRLEEDENGVKRLKFIISDAESGQDIDLDDFLRAKNVPVLGERIPIIAYGSNMNPSSLFHKFDYGYEGDNTLDIVPVIRATRRGSEVVWSKKLGLRGRPFADIITTDETATNEINIAVSFLAHDQLALMHATEFAYDIIEQGEVELEGGLIIPGFYYSGETGEALAVDGMPAAVSAIKAEKRASSDFNAEEATNVMVQRVIDFTGENGYKNAAEFLAFYEGLDDEQKLTIRALFNYVMNKAYYKHIFTRPDDAVIHEWAYNLLPSFNQLINGYEYTGVQGRLFTNDQIADSEKRRVVEAKLYDERRMRPNYSNN